MTGVLDQKRWLQEGVLLQVSKDRYLLGQGPFQSHPNPSFGFYRPDFFLQDKLCWLVPHKYDWLCRRELLQFLRSNVLSKQHRLHQVKAASFLEFQNTFYEIQNQIKQSQIQKIVPVFYERLKGQVQVGSLLNQFFKKSQQAYSHSYLYGYWDRHSGFLGFSPEVLFLVENQLFYTMALAGTSMSLGPSLFNDSKEIKEHQYVIQGIEDSLKDLVHWERTKTYEKIVGSIKHLCTEKRARLLKNFDYVEFCNRCHPTAALGAYPKQEGLLWLRQHPKQSKRAFFGAPFGYRNGRQYAFCIVAIRNLEWMDSQVKIYSGAGILAESILQKEWRELFLKREQVKNLFLSS